MWSREKLKTNAKAILRKNYWWVVLVTIIFGIVAGEGVSVSPTNYFSGFRSGLNNAVSSDFSDNAYTYGDTENIVGDSSYYDSLYRQFDNYDWKSEFGNIFDGMTAGLGVIILIIFMLVLVISLGLSIFVFAPLSVGCRRWYLKNRTKKPELSELIYVFNNGYINTVKVMFCKGLFTFFWSLLFVIPGIIKSYEYRMIPYLLAENPNMDMHEAFERSKSMMYGNKAEAFVLDLSFIGWEILSVFTCGILALLYVNPYIQLTNTELYVALCQTRVDGTYTNSNDLSGNSQYETSNCDSKLEDDRQLY